MDQFLDVLRLGGGHGVDHPADLVVAEIRALAAVETARAGPEEEQVAVAQQLVGPHLVEHDAAVGAAGHLEGDPRGQVRLDQPGDDVHGRLLRGQDEVDAHRPALLGQANDVPFDLFGGGHHQVGHLVGHDDDVRHVRGDVLPLLVVHGANAIKQLLAAQLVVDAYVTHARPGQEPDGAFHLLDGPAEDRLGLPHVGHHGVHEVRDGLVGAQLDHLRIDQQQPDFVGPAGHEDRDDDRVQTDALARAGAAGDEQVRQRGEIDDHRAAGHVLAEEDRDPHGLDAAVGLFHHLAEADELPLGVGHLDSHRVLAGDRGDDPHARHPQGDRQVVGQPGDPAQSQPRFELDLELGDHRAGLDLDDADVEAEVGEGLFQDLGLPPDVLLLLVEGERLAGQEQIDPRKLVIDRPAAPVGFDLFEPLVAFGLLGLADPQRRARLLGVFRFPCRRNVGAGGSSGSGGFGLGGGALRLLARRAGRDRDGCGVTVMRGCRDVRRVEVRAASRASDDLVGIGRADAADRAAELPGWTADQPDQQLQHDVVARQEQAALDQAHEDDVGPGGGEVSFQEAAGRRAQIAAGADHRAGRPTRHGHRRHAREANQRQQPANQAKAGGLDRAAGQEQGVDDGQRQEQVVRADAEGAEQERAGPDAGAAAEVGHGGPLGGDQLAGRVGGVVAQEGGGQEDRHRQQAQGRQVDSRVPLWGHIVKNRPSSAANPNPVRHAPPVYPIDIEGRSRAAVESGSLAQPYPGPVSVAQSGVPCITPRSALT